MKLKLDKKNRKYISIDVEVDGVTTTLRYYEKNTRQIKELREAFKKEDTTLAEALTEQQFLENLKGDKQIIDELIEFYEENGNFYDFMGNCEEALGKLKKKD